MNGLLHAVRQQGERQPQSGAFVDGHGTVTYESLRGLVGGFSAAAAGWPDTVGLLAPSSTAWAVADLGFWLAGKTVVPLPHFFSDEQLGHIVQDAGITAIVADDSQAARARALGAEVLPLRHGVAEWSGDATAKGRRIVYTSGSTGKPKGVILGAGQIEHSCGALMQTVEPGAQDTHLSVLPFSLLLEAICGIYMPVMAGGCCHVAPEIVAATGIDIAVRLGETAARVRPTTSVLVPQLLQAWVLASSVGRVTPPDSLRFVAVGGAAVPEPLAARAWDLGIPVHEGYGLTECGSVVAVNAPGARRAGTVGRPLPGFQVDLTPEGEIAVTSRSVCSGYLNATGDAEPGRWLTGDLGRFDAGGNLIVLGRKDNLIVTANGRNVSPEWVETMLLADPRIARAVALAGPDGDLGVLLEPSMLGDGWFRTADTGKLDALIAGLCAAAPAYAVPRQFVVLTRDVLAEAGLLTANGRPRRAAIAEHYADRFASIATTTETANAVL